MRTIPEVVASWAASRDLVTAFHVPGRRGDRAILDPPVHPLLNLRLEATGVYGLFHHQVAAISNIRRDRNTAIVAGTASGKSLCYQIPIVERILSGPSTSLLVYPTKALAQDQLRSFNDLDIPEIYAATYDGDTPTESRRRIRRRSNVVLTNPDMLNLGILPNHQGWQDFLSRLDIVVIDEMHAFRGIFGSHVALIIRRLRRIAAHYGADPTFVFSSATIGNPAELATGLCGLDVEIVDHDTSPSPSSEVVLWNPPVRDDNRRRSVLAEATDRFCELIEAGLNTIAFSRSRKGTELMYRWAAERLGRDLISPYRAGYLPRERRKIEQRLFSGELKGVIATNALELGIDIGNLEAAVLAGYPGTITGFRQQAGRAGRRKDASLVVLIAGEDALDQYFMAHHRELLTRPAEAAVINPANPEIVEAHLACAAHELGVSLEDRRILGDIEESANSLVQRGDAFISDGMIRWAGRRSPAARINIRASGGNALTLIADGEAIGTLDRPRVFRDAHPGATYLQQGETYLVERLDLDGGEVRLASSHVDYYTQAREEKHLEVLSVHAVRDVGPAEYFYGKVRVEAHVVAYQRRRVGSSEVLETVPLDLPPTEFTTEATWLAIPSGLVSGRRLLGALHAAEHAAIALLPLLAICDRWDLGGLSTDWHPQTGRSSIFIYEAYPGGAGISAVAHGEARTHLEATLDTVTRCPCDGGCPSCVQSPKCGNLNEPLDKEGAAILLQRILA